MTWKEFLDMTPNTKSIKEKTDKLDSIKMKIVCSVKDTVKGIKRQTTDWEKIFANHISDKGLVSKINNKLSKLIGKKTNNPINNRQNGLPWWHSG